MTLALKAPHIVQDIVSVDNAPLDAALLSSFGSYIQGMRKIEDAGVTRQAEADKILQDYEEVVQLCRTEVTESMLMLHFAVTSYPSIPPRKFIPAGR